MKFIIFAFSHDYHHDHEFEDILKDGIYLPHSRAHSYAFKLSYGIETCLLFTINENFYDNYVLYQVYINYTDFYCIQLYIVCTIGVLNLTLISVAQESYSDELY